MMLVGIVQAARMIVLEVGLDHKAAPHYAVLQRKEGGDVLPFGTVRRIDGLSLRDPGGSALPVIRLADGRLALCSSNDGGWHYRLQPIAWESRDFGNAISLGTTTRVFDGAGEDNFYLYDSSALYAYGTDGGERRALFRWSELGLAGGDAFVLPLGEGRFAILASVFSQTGRGSYEYCLVAPGEDTRTVLHMTSLQPDTTILEAIAQFNKRSSDYRVELRAFFSQAEDVSEADAAVIMAIVAHQSGVPLNRLAFHSIKLIKEDA